MDTIGHLLGKTLTRAGYGVLVSKDYMSRVRGGHNFVLLRVEETTPWAPAAQVDLLVALNAETFRVHSERLTADAQIIFDPQAFSLPGTASRATPIELSALARASGGAMLASTVAVGAVLALGSSCSEPLELAQAVLNELYDPPLREQNLAALSAGFTAGLRFRRADAIFPRPAVTCEHATSSPRLFVDGSAALGMAALASGCRFVSAYPMTPATGIVTYLAAKQHEYGLVVEQAEDEICAINMVLGASFAGARSLTCTSGGGFALMTEGLSLAGVMEVGIVIVLAMRPGPATGLPTRTEQGDLNFAIFGGHGEFPRAVLSATALEDAFYRLSKAFHLADKYQMPVIFLTDQHFADTARSIPPYDFSRLAYERHLVGGELGDALPYLRYRYTPNGLSPRALPGQYGGEMVLADSHEHDEHGHISEDADIRKDMMHKRMLRMETVRAELDEPVFYGHREAKLLLVGWGSTYGALREAVDVLCAAGKKAAMLHFSDLWPLPLVSVSQLLPAAETSFCIENNATGQFAALLRREANLKFTHSVLKYDGRAFTAEEIVREILS